ncbi:MAG: DUF4012 domain-containing protein [Chloroflexi bacterium]|nr:DUF4012 domain-containing protein [Chloroflexota bacterium]
MKRLGVRRRFNGIIVGIVSISIAAVVIYAALVVDSLSTINSSITELERILTSIEGGSAANVSLNDYERLADGVEGVDESLEVSQRRLALVRPFQTIDPNVDAALRSLDIARKLTSSAKTMLSGLRPAVFYLVAGEDADSALSQVSSGDRLVELLEIGNGQFVKAQTEIEEARVMIDGLNVQNASLDIIRMTERIIDFYAQVSSLNSVLINSNDLLNVVLGLDGDKTYLVLAVNSDELRPSGGFLSTWGWFQVRGGRITDFSYSASTATSPMPPTDELADQLAIPPWWIQFRQPMYAAWDGSWHADFPSTAEMAMWYYNNGSNEHAPVDGVISIDLYGFEYILEALGSVPVPAQGLEVTSANFRRLVYDIRANSSGLEPHKQFVADIYQQIMAQWQESSSDPETNNLIMNALLRAVQEKHVMVHLANSDLNNAIDLLGWSGAQRTTANSDYLMVVDTNLGNKSNRSVVRELTYDVVLHDDGLLGKRLTIAYEYPQELAESDPAVDPEFHGRLDYGNLLQVFGPSDSTLVDYPRNTNYPSQSELHDLWMVSTAFVVPFNDSRRIQFEYDSPNGWEQFGRYGRYRLLIQKQPGTRGDPVTVQITLPPGTKVVESNPPLTTTYDLDQIVVEYRLNLTTDVMIDLIFEFRPEALAQLDGA